MFIDMNTIKAPQPDQYGFNSGAGLESQVRPGRFCRPLPFYFVPQQGAGPGPLDEALRQVAALVQPIIQALLAVIQNLAAQLGVQSEAAPNPVQNVGTGSSGSPAPSSVNEVTDNTGFPLEPTSAGKPNRPLGEAPAGAFLETKPETLSSIGDTITSFTQTLSEALTATSDFVGSLNTSLNTIVNGIKKPLADLVTKALKLFGGGTGLKSLFHSAFKMITNVLK